MGGQRKQKPKNEPIEYMGCPGKTTQGLVSKLIFALCLGEDFTVFKGRVVYWAVFMGKGVGDSGYFFSKLFELKRSLPSGWRLLVF